MNNESIFFKSDTQLNLQYRGRNGYGKMKGIYLSASLDNSRLILSPISGNGYSTAAQLEIPIGNLRAVAQALLKLADQLDTLP